MENLLKTEFYKLFHSGYFWITAVFSFLLSSILLLDSKGETSNLFFASLYNTPLLFFLILVYASLFVGDDLGGKTLHLYLTAGHKRGLVFLAKAVAYQAGCMLILFVPLLIHGWIGRLCMKETWNAVDGIFLMVLLLSAMTMCLLPFFLAFVFRDMGRTLAVSMVLFFLMIFWMNGDKAPDIIGILPMGQLRLLALEQWHAADFSFATVDFLWNFILYLGAGILFDRVDLK